MGPGAEPHPDVLRTWFRFLRLHQRITARATQEFRALGLSLAQFDLLSNLSDGEGVSQQDLVEKLFVTKGNVSGLVDRLAAAGLVERRPLPGDRRSHALHLTTEGRAVTERGLALQRRLVGATLGRLSPADVAELDRLVSLWREAVRELPVSESSPAGAA